MIDNPIMRGNLIKMLEVVDKIGSVNEVKLLTEMNNLKNWARYYGRADIIEILIGQEDQVKNLNTIKEPLKRIVFSDARTNFIALVKEFSKEFN